MSNSQRVAFEIIIDGCAALNTGCDGGLPKSGGLSLSYLGSTSLDSPSYSTLLFLPFIDMTTSPPNPEVLSKKGSREERSVSRIRRSGMFHGLIDILSTSTLLILNLLKGAPQPVLCV